MALTEDQEERVKELIELAMKRASDMAEENIAAVKNELQQTISQTAAQQGASGTRRATGGG